jgi:hypothetical protein
VPGPHPDDDLLADLAADVLSVEQARIVEAHVLQCDRCAELLSDAERVRRLLLAGDPGPVPPAVWSRIEAALHAETNGSPADRRPAPPERSRPAAPPSLAETGAWDGPDPLDDPDRWNGTRSPTGGTAGTVRNVVPATGSLRRLTTSRRDTRKDRRGLPLPLVIATAAVVAAFAVVGTAQLLRGGSAASSSGSAALSSGTAQDSRAAAADVLVSSGRNYTARDLARQVRPLLAAGAAKGSAGSTEASRAGAAPQPRASASPSETVAAGTSQAPSASARSALALAPDPRATDVRNPQRLAACLAALNASHEPLVAVDLARFQDREAAVLVLRAPAGGYEVFVVERTCAAGNEGTLDFTRLPG